MDSWFVNPEALTVPLSNGKWILIRRRLNMGEARAVWRRTYVSNGNGTHERYADATELTPSLVVGYLLDWNAVDAQGQPVPLRGKSPEDVRAALDLLDPGLFNEVADAISAHDMTIRTAQQEEKKRRMTETSSSKTSPSPDDAAGDTSGSPV